jgi:hypothetical protein
VTVGYDARLCMSAEVLAKPQLLRRAGAAASHTGSIAVGVERDDVPGAQVVAVVALADWTGLRAPVFKIRRGVGNAVLVVSQSGPGAILETTPGRPVAVAKLGHTAMLVGKIPGGKHGAGNLLDQFGCGSCTLNGPAARDVSRADERKYLILRELTVDGSLLSHDDGSSERFRSPKDPQL